MVVANGCAVAIHVSHTARTSSPKLKIQLLNGSGLVFTAARALAFVPCEVRATPPAKGLRPSAIRRDGARQAPERRCGGRANEGVNCVPDGVEVRNFVGKKFNQIESAGDSENPRVGKNLQGRRKLQNAVPLEKTERGHSCVEIQAGGKSGAEGEAERFDRIHPCPS